ncbi:MAG: cobaltochelatase subunit CobN [Candidatus Promineifilaceae bacterium]
MRRSYPAALWAELPHLYPFIVNDPGEGTQAKRRTGAVIIDHLVPPLTRAETYGPLKDLEALLDEYYAASGMDRRRLRRPAADASSTSPATPASIAMSASSPTTTEKRCRRIDTFLCDLKEAQIRDGLHIFGQSPDRPPRTRPARRARPRAARRRRRRRLADPRAGRRPEARHSTR